MADGRLCITCGERQGTRERQLRVIRSFVEAVRRAKDRLDSDDAIGAYAALCEVVPDDADRLARLKDEADERRLDEARMEGRRRCE